MDSGPSLRRTANWTEYSNKRQAWIASCRNARSAIEMERRERADAKKRLPWNRVLLGAVDSLLKSRAVHRVPAILVDNLETFSSQFEPRPVELADVLSKVQEKPLPPEPPKSIFIYGPVGTGKSMLMDLLYSSCPHIDKKRRVHFNSFISEITWRLHAYSKSGASFRMSRLDDNRSILGDELLDDCFYDPNIHDPFSGVTRDLVGDAAIICFDELQ